MLVSPTEPLRLRKLGEVSSIPEQFGVDFLIDDTIGVQRKEAKDWVTSVFDGRLAKESAQWNQLSRTILILEGGWRWSGGGILLEPWSQGFSLAMHHGLLMSISASGVWVWQSSNLDETCSFLRHLEQWAAKEQHQGLSRPSPEKGSWGTRSNKDWACWMLQGFEGIGKKTAETLVDRFGLPLQWTVTIEELMTVPGIGKGRAERLWKSLQNESAT